MAASPSPSPLQLSARVYEGLLVVYPKRYRAEYGPAMAQLFRDLARESYGQARGWGLAGLWLRVLADTSRSAGEEHWQALSERLRCSLAADQTWMRTGWAAYLLAAVCVGLGIIAKALVLRQTQSPAAAAGVLAGALLLTSILLDRVVRGRGQMLLAAVMLSALQFLPLAWLPNATAWLKDNPSMAYFVISLPFSWGYGRHALRNLWLSVAIYGGVNVLIALLLGA